MTLSIILPVYNPTPGWAAVVQDRLAAVRSSLPHLSIEVMIVNDGSTNATYSAEINKLKDQGYTILSNPSNHGKGFAIRQGVRQAMGDYLLYTDIDFPYTTQSMIAVIQLLIANKADVVIGIKNESYYSHVPMIRKLISKTLRAFIKLLFKIKITDTQCGLKGFNHRGREVFLRTTIDRYLFDLEFIALVSDEPNMSILPMPVALYPTVVFTEMSSSLLLSELKNFWKILFRK